MWANAVCPVSSCHPRDEWEANAFQELFGSQYLPGTRSASRGGTFPLCLVGASRLNAACRRAGRSPVRRQAGSARDGRGLAPPSARSRVGRFAPHVNPQAVDVLHDPFRAMRSVGVNPLRSQSYEYVQYFILNAMIFFYKDMVGMRKHFYLNSKPAFAQGHRSVCSTLQFFPLFT